jgi:hypothetical protein
LSDSYRIFDEIVSTLHSREVMDQKIGPYRNAVVSQQQLRSTRNCSDQSRAVRLLAFCLLVLVACGCRLDNRVELLQLDSVQVQEFEPSVRLRLNGSGFPTGRACEVFFDGKVYRFNGDTGPFETTLAGKAVSPEWIEADLTPADIKLLGKAGTFEGKITAAFTSQDGQAQITGTSPEVRLELSHNASLNLKERRGQSVRARALAAFIGVEVVEESNSDSGLLIKEVWPESRAERAGLKQADRISMQGESFVHAIIDLLPAPGSSEVELRVVRAGEQASVVVRIPLYGLNASPLDAAQLQLLALVAFALLCVAFFSPVAQGLGRYLSRFVQRRSVAAEAQLSTTHNRRVAKGNRFAGLRWIDALAKFFIEPLTFALIVVALFFSRLVYGIVFDPLVVCLALFILRISFTLFISRGSNLRQRLRTAFRCSRYMVFACAPIAMGCVLAETRSLSGFVAAQGAAPWQWLVFRNPALTVVFPLFMLSSAAGFIAYGDSSRDRATLTRWFEVVYRALMCAFAAALFVGGWQVARLPLLNAIDSDWSNAAVFLLKASALAYLAYAIRVVRLEENVGRWAPLFALLGSGALTLLWRYADVSAQVEATIGYALFIAFTVVSTVAIGRVLAARNKPAAVSPHPNPFL